MKLPILRNSEYRAFVFRVELVASLSMTTSFFWPFYLDPGRLEQHGAAFSGFFRYALTFTT